MKEIIKASWDPGRTNWGLICHFWLSLECKVKWIFWDIFHTYSEELLYDILQISDQFFERIYACELMRYFSVWGPSHQEHLSCVWCLCWLAAEQKSPRSTHRGFLLIHHMQKQPDNLSSIPQGQPIKVAARANAARASASLRQLPLQVERGKGGQKSARDKKDERPPRWVNLHYYKKGNHGFTLPVFMMN